MNYRTINDAIERRLGPPHGQLRVEIVTSEDRMFAACGEEDDHFACPEFAFGRCTCKCHRRGQASG